MFSAAKTAATSSGGYSLNRSLRFRSSASAYLNRSQTAGSTTTWTWSGWVKRGTLGVNARLAAAGSITGTYNYTQLTFDTSDRLVFAFYPNTNDGWLTTTQVFRDPSAWYHIVAVFDSTNATSTNRMRLYVNGAQVTSFTTGVFATTYPNQNDGSYFNNASYGVRIGNSVPGDTAYYFDGYMTEVNFIDGQALTPSSFGAYNSTTGVWQPIKYAGSYGTNGFYLNFNNNASTTTLGYDTSGNGNNWTTNNISLTAGVTYDSMTDVPTLTSATVANFAVWNPIIQPYTNTTRTTIDGNLNGTLASSGAGGSGTFSTIGMSTGSWYAEFTVLQIGSGTNLDIGILQQDQLGSLGNGTYGAIGYSPYGYSVYQTSGAYANNNASSASGTSYTTNDIVQVAFNASTGKLWFGKNGTFMSSGDPVAGTNPAFSSIPSNTYLFAFGLAAGVSGRTVQVVANFGQRPFSYTPPTGFVALNTYNLPTPSISNGANYFAATTYSGTGATQTITNGGNNSIGTTFKPDLLWTKRRDAAGNNALQDSVRGSTLQLSSNLTSAELTDATEVTSFNTNGFSVGNASGAGYGVNISGGSYIGWQWQAGAGSSSSNTNGSITSTVSVNATAGFSVVTYTGNGTGGATIGHGLGVAPQFIAVKSRSASNDWINYHVSLGNTQYLNLDLTSAAATSSAAWNNTSPTSTVFSAGTGPSVNSNGVTYVAYCWTAVAGFSKFGSYTGNGSTDGTFVYTGFRPRYIMIKRTDNVGDWWILDTSRDNYNVMNNELFADTSGAEAGGNAGGTIDFLSNGFKLRCTTQPNTSSGTFVYACFAENPFRNSLAR